VPVDRGSLAAILRLAELGLAPADSAAMAGAREAIKHISATLGGDADNVTGGADNRGGDAAQTTIVETK
jgi:hypothetical protein